ncbi:hypothetical protein PHYC_03155 [Phycisphaerales bacterium]|nr:hypothetical protein PHYC_03155 [Phycisphaerales bacterium]
MKRWRIGFGVAALAVLVAGVVIAWPWLYFGPTLPRADQRAAWRAHALESSGLGVHQAESAWERYQLVLKLQAKAYEQVFGPLPVEANGRPAIRDAIDFDPPGGMTPGQQAEASRLFGTMKSTGLFEALDAVAMDRAFVRPLPPAGLLLGLDLGDLTYDRALFRALRFHAREAARAGDAPEVERTLVRSLGLARVCAAEPITISCMVGIAIASATAEEAIELAAGGALPPESCNRIAKLFMEFESLSTADLIDGEAILMRDTLQETLGETPITPINRSAQTAKLNEVVESAKKWSALPAWDRRDAPFDLDASGSLRYKPALILLPAFDRLGWSREQWETTRRGTAIVLAVHAYTKVKGNPPAVLDALVPEYLPSVPVDPWTGKGFGYRVLESPDEHGRRFLVYSAGWDGEDNAGRPHPKDRTVSLQQPGSGTDFVINTPAAK